MTEATLVEIVAVRFPDIGEPQELDALAAEPGVRFRWVAEPGALGGADVVVLPGSEKTLRDLAWLRATGLFDEVRRAHARGSMILAICGGYQMLGRRLDDPERLEGGDASAEGLGLLGLDTRFARDPVEEPTRATSSGAWLPPEVVVPGRELHGGRSTWLGGEAVPLFRESAKGGGTCPLGLVSRDGSIVGTYLHDVAESEAFRSRLLQAARARRAQRNACGSPGTPSAPAGT